jgi:hypothetical protein
MEWCVRSWDEIRVVHRSMRNDSRVADGLYIKRVLLALEDFLFFSLYSFSCIAKQVTTLKQLRLLSCLALSCLDSLETNLESFAPLRYYIIIINITYARPRPLQTSGSAAARREIRPSGVIAKTINHRQNAASGRFYLSSDGATLRHINHYGLIHDND